MVKTCFAVLSYSMILGDIMIGECGCGWFLLENSSKNLVDFIVSHHIVLQSHSMMRNFALIESAQ